MSLTTAALILFEVSVGAPDAVGRFDVFELALTAAGDYTNPYLQMPHDATTPGFVVGTFTAPDGNVITMDGFWDGGHTWRIRMAPTAVGKWSYRTRSSDPGLNDRPVRSPACLRRATASSESIRNIHTISSGMTGLPSTRRRSPGRCTTGAQPVLVR